MTVREARALIRQNVETLGAAGVTRIFRSDATKLGDVHPNEPFSLVFLDPPYGKGLAEKALVSARDGGWLTPDALIVVEEVEGCVRCAGRLRGDRAARLRRYGDRVPEADEAIVPGDRAKRGRPGSIASVHVSSGYGPRFAGTTAGGDTLLLPNSLSISVSFNST